jgi:putative SOS response-associated peptidase YedK
MCYNIAYLEARAKKYFERYKDALPPDWRPEHLQQEFPLYYFVSAFEHPVLPIVTENGIVMAKWGLVPFWINNLQKAEEISKMTLNATGENVFVKKSFKTSIKKKRCLVGVSGFYEWRDLNGIKYPYYISLTGNDIFSLGGIYDSWTDTETGEIHHTFSVITTPANPMMENIHNLKKRMPLIIPRSSEKQWIGNNLSTEDINHLIKPYEAGEMQAYTVSKYINNARNFRNTEEAIRECVYAELQGTGIL